MPTLLVEPGPPVPQARGAAVNLPALRRDLDRIADTEFRFDAVSRALYATDASVYQITPLGVALPRTQEALAAIVAACHRHRCPLTLRGGGTSQAGQAIGDGLVVDTSRHLNRLIEVNVEERWARVEPGLVLETLNRALAPHGLRFAPDISTASRATVGGMMANNSSGARSVLYGTTIHHVLRQRVALADGSVVDLGPLSGEPLDAACAGDTLAARGYRAVRRLGRTHADEIARRFPRLLRRVGGYNLDAFTDPDAPVDLTRLMVGSEGTLGVVLEATLRLVPLPAAKAVLVLQFDVLADALEATPHILRHGPSAIEIMDRSILANTAQSPALDRLRRTFMDGDPEALLCVEFYGERADDLPPRMDAVERDLAAHGLTARAHRALDAAAQARIWGVREAALGLSMAVRSDAKALSFVEDTAVAPERLRDYITRLLGVVQRHGTTASLYAHASVGCLHVRPVVNLKTEAGVRMFEAIATDVADLVLEFGGALSGEHGDGLVRSPFMRKMFGPVLHDAFREIKRTFDPHGILNPGKIVDPPPLTSNLRYGPGWVTPRPPTYFDFDDDGGFGGAVDMCSGLGACRKVHDGTMCPSFMATREERDSTRGRANVLRLALAGRLGEAGLDDHGVREALDLCLECRACRAECPVGVDMARYKSEFLAGYHARHGTPAGARVLGHIHGVSRLASRVAPLANALAASAPVRALNARLLGLDPRRPLPRWAPQPLSRWWARRAPGAAGTPGPSAGHAGVAVTLFGDTFTDYFHPAVGRAAVGVLERAGATVSLAAGACCGRPLISQGLLDDARAQAARTVEALRPMVEGGRPLLVLEPSCLSALREDLPSLLRGPARDNARRVAEAAVSLEAWLEDALASGRLSLPIAPGPRRVLLHGHCHQKAMQLVAPARALLSRIPGAEVVDLDAGCCGMAGSFGYGRDHYDVSVAIGERRLLPAARALGPDGVLVAAGTSCRQQVADLAGTSALHPVQLIHALAEEMS